MNKENLMKQQIRKNSKAITEYRKRFYNLYHTKIVPIMLQFEQERKNDLFLLYCLEIVAVGFLATSITWLFQNSIMSAFSPILIVLSIVAIIAIPICYNNRFIKKLKAACMPKIVACFDNLRWYDCTAEISDTELRSSQLFANYNRRTSYDAFDGSYSGVPFKISETNMWYESGSGKNKTVVQIFRGITISFAANKNIKNTTIIATKNDKNIKNNSAIGFVGLLGLYQLFIPDSDGHFNIAGIIFALIIVFIVWGCISLANKCSNNEVLDEMKLEDPEFNKKYKAYSSDQVEGRYLITPAFIERFNNLQTAFGTNKAKCSFYGDKLMFAISTNKNLFEIGNLFKRLDNPKQMETFFNELASIMALVDLFKLDEKTGL